MKTKNFKKRNRPTKKKRHRKTKKHQQHVKRYRGGATYEGNSTSYQFVQLPSQIQGYLRVRYHHPVPFVAPLVAGDTINITYPIETGEYITWIHTVRADEAGYNAVDFDIPYERAIAQQAYATWQASQGAPASAPAPAPAPSPPAAASPGAGASFSQHVPTAPPPAFSGASRFNPAGSPAASPPPRRGGPPPSFNQSSARTRARSPPRPPPSSPPGARPSSPPRPRPRACPPGKYCPGYSWSDDIGGCKQEDPGDFPTFNDCNDAMAPPAPAGPAYTAQDQAHILAVLAGHGITTKRKVLIAIRTYAANDINLQPNEAIVIYGQWGQRENLDTMSKMVGFAKLHNLF